MQTLERVSPVAAQGDGGSQTVLLVATLVALVLILVIAVKLNDLKKKREEESVFLQARISDALFGDAKFSRMALTPTAHVPFWRGSPVRVAIAGPVPTPELREAAVRAVVEEMSRHRPDFAIEDRIAVDPFMFKRAA